jgi:Cof subfamily protein (haloacid dehalogenase superfamily)
MRIKLVAIDLDGTLLQPDHTISSATHSAIAACVTQDVQIVLASGRSWRSLRPYAEALDLKGPMICLNGAALGDSARNTLVARCQLQPRQIDHVSGLLMERNIHFTLFGLDAIYALPDWADPEALVVYGEPPATIVPDFSLEHVPDPIKILSFVEPGPLDQELHALTAGFVDQVRTHRYFLEWMPKGINKGDALHELATRLELQRDEVMSIGDGDNDISMFQQSGISVAMASAAPTVRREAAYTTGSNVEEGVVAALERFVLNREERREKRK